MNILLTGGSGLIGSKLVEKLIEEGHKVRILTREQDVHPPFYNWNNDKIDEKAFEDLDGIIHLAGATISKRWTKSYKAEIINSRVNTANLLYKYVEKLKPHLKFFISASGTAYYGQITSDKIFDENDSNYPDFLSDVSVKWENAANQFKDFGARVVCLRTSLVLAKNGESFKLLKKPIELYVGANLGTGKQWFPWIHIEDLISLYAKAVDDISLNGSYNASSPDMINHSQFNHQLAKHLNKPFYLPNIPSFVMKTILGEMSILVLEASRINPQKIQEAGYVFKFPTLEEALGDLI